MNIIEAGWAQGEITPPLGLPLVSNQDSTSVLDPLCAQSVVIKDRNGRRMLWLAIDLLGVSHTFSDALRVDISAITSIPIDAIIINCSHTHSGPHLYADMTIANDRDLYLASQSSSLISYINELGRKLAQLAFEASNSMRPVTATLHEGVSDVAINRRRPVDDNVFNAPNPDGYYNRDLWVLDLQGQSESDRCVIFSYACHPVIVYRYAADSISADFVGRCRQSLRSILGDSVHCQFMQSLAGNVKPRAMADLQKGQFLHASEQVVASVANQLASDVVRALDGSRQSLELDLGYASGWCQFPRDQKSIDQLIETWSQSESQMLNDYAKYWSKRVQEGPPLASVVPWAIGLIRLTNEHWIVSLGGEPLAEWLPHIRQWMNNQQVFAWGYCHDSQGYLPTDELLSEPGYETQRNAARFRYGPGAFKTGIGDIMRNQLIELSKKLDVPPET